MAPNTYMDSCSVLMFKPLSNYSDKFCGRFSVSPTTMRNMKNYHTPTYPANMVPQLQQMLPFPTRSCNTDYYKTPFNPPHNRSSLRRYTPPMQYKPIDKFTPFKRRTVSESCTPVNIRPSSTPADVQKVSAVKNVSSTHRALQSTLTCAELEGLSMGKVVPAPVCKTPLTCAEVEALSANNKRSQSPAPSVSSGYESCEQLCDLQSEISVSSCPPSPFSVDSAFDAEDFSLVDNVTFVNSKFTSERSSSPKSAIDGDNICDNSLSSTITPVKSTSITNNIEPISKSNQKYNCSNNVTALKASQNLMEKFSKLESRTDKDISKSAKELESKPSTPKSNVPSKFLYVGQEIIQTKDNSSKIRKSEKNTTVIYQFDGINKKSAMPPIVSATPVACDLPPPPSKWTQDDADLVKKVDITEHIMMLTGVKSGQNTLSPIRVC